MDNIQDSNKQSAKIKCMCQDPNYLGECIYPECHPTQNPHTEEREKKNREDEVHKDASIRFAMYLFKYPTEELTYDELWDAFCKNPGIFAAKPPAPPEDNTDVAIPEEVDGSLAVIRKWVDEHTKCPDGMTDCYEMGFMTAASKIVNIYNKAQEQAKRFDAQIEALKEEVRDSEDVCRDVLKGNYITNYRKLIVQIAYLEEKIVKMKVDQLEIADRCVELEKENGEYRECLQSLVRNSRMIITMGFDPTHIQKLLEKYPSATEIK